jgi:YHS domain-containing protein
MQFAAKSTNWLVAMVIALAIITMGMAAQKPATKSINTRHDVALRGYDAVAYFQDGKPIKGRDEFKHEWMGVTWQFASAANRDRFAQNPEMYAPQYGGYCAYAASQNYIYDADPKVWKIVNGKLYLNYNQQAQQLWEQDVPGNIKKGDQHWPQLIK